MTKRDTITLESIQKPFTKELVTFDQVLRDSLRSSIPLVRLLERYLVRQQGKRVRPLLVLLSAKLCGGITERTFRGASLIEILHIAALIHDDVVDDADLRRGAASINAIWKNKVAVLMGDYLLSQILLLALHNQDIDFLETTSIVGEQMTEGELLQVQKSRQLDTDEATYFEIIRGKTAELFAACAKIGAASATSDPVVQKALYEYGEKIGIIFQIRDDILDYTGHRSIMGKPIASDIKEKKLTLPLIGALKNVDSVTANKIIKKIKVGATSRDIQQIVKFVHQNNGIAYSLQKAEAIAQEAIEHLSIFEDSPAKQSLIDFVTYVLNRSN